MKIKIANIVSLGILFCAGCLLLIVIYWMVAPYPVLTVDRIETLTPRVKQGGELKIRAIIDKHLPYASRGWGQIENDFAYPLAEQHYNAPVGKNDWILTFKIPENVHPGTDYKFRRVYIFQVNPIRSVKYEWVTPFEVVAK